MKFEMKIESDNADNGPEMVAYTLNQVAALIMEFSDRRGQIRDANGNTVGDWEMSES